MKTVLLYFSASWCQPCKRLAPLIDEILSENKDVALQKVDIEEQPDLVDQFGIKSVPTIVMCKVAEVLTGTQTKETYQKAIEALRS